MNHPSAINSAAGILAACALLLTTTAANAGILYSNFDGVTFTTNGNNISAVNSPSLSFTATGTGNLSSVLVAGQFTIEPNLFIFSLYDHSDTLIESWSASFNEAGMVVTLTSVTNALLTSGQNYKLTASPGDDAAWGSWLYFDASTPTLRINGMDSVPEPATFALFGGAAALGLVTLRRRKK